MRLRKAFRRVTITPVVAAMILGSTLLCACAPESVEVTTPSGFACRMMLLASTDCAEDTLGWVGSSEDDRFRTPWFCALNLGGDILCEDWRDIR